MNNRRTRSNDYSSSSFHRYLKPGALARLRDSKITTTTRSHRTYINRSLSSSSFVSASPSVDNLQIIAEHCVSGRMCNVYSPRFLQRKKLVAARSMLNCYLLQPASPVVSEVGDLATGGDVAAH